VWFVSTSHLRFFDDSVEALPQTPLKPFSFKKEKGLRIQKENLVPKANAFGGSKHLFFLPDTAVSARKVFEDS